MNLSRLFQNADPAVALPAGGDPPVNAICYDSRRVMPGALFAAVRGTRVDGHDFIPDALARGAAALLVERPLAAPVPVVISPDVRRSLAQAAAAFYGSPSTDLFVVGITGTNGKTTTAYLVESVLSAAGHRVGMVGTIDYHYAGQTFANPVTTPESLDLQRILAAMRSAGITHVVMEVSSHALDQHRVEGIQFNVGIFTNLTQDHLDYHRNMEAYWQCKRRLFTDHLPRGPKADRAVAVVNRDDPHGRRLAKDLGRACLTCGADAQNRIHPLTWAATPAGLKARLATPLGPIAVDSALVGRHNLDNIMAAVGCGVGAGLSPQAIQRGIGALQRVPGRLEKVPDPAERHVYVDYAHTPDALEHALAALRPLTAGRLICVFGCGGDRDRTKRPLMGEIAGRLADRVVVTSDNPRSEPPMRIIDDILPGLRRAAAEDRFVVEPDRFSAIDQALSLAGRGDTVLIAGKGHENYQVLADRTIAFDDRQAVRQTSAQKAARAVAETPP